MDGGESETIEKIIDGILAAINKAFGEGYTLYTESVEQGMKGPCFFITCISPGTRLYRGRRYLHTNRFMIQYMTNVSEPRAECVVTAERLFSCLELISVDGELLRGTDMNADIIAEDNMLNFMVNYDFFSYKPNKETKMEEIEGMETTLKG